MRTGSRPYIYKPDPRQRYSSSQQAGAPGDLRGLMAAMHRYLEHRAMLGSTNQGLYNHERFLRDFIEWGDTRGVTHPQQVSRAVLERYQRWLFHYRKADGEPLHVRTQRSKVFPLKSFFRWLTKTAEIPANPAADLDMPRQIETIPHQVLTAQEAETILSLADTSTAVGLRDRAIMEMFYATGIRRMELVNLAVDDVDTLRCVVLIREGKGRKDRLVPMGERALHWVQRYLDQSRPQLVWDANERTMFLGREGLPLISNWVCTLMTRYIRLSGVGKKGSCHLWRHTMATLMLEGGADIRVIQAMLGHADISSTQIYTQVAIRHLSKVHAATHPGAKLRTRGVDKTEAALGVTDEQTPATPEALWQALEEEAEQEDEPG